VTAACLSKRHVITGVDIVRSKVDLINRGESPIVEPEVDELVANARLEGKLSAVHDQDFQIDDTDAVIVCVGTPSKASGEVDLTALVKVTESIGNKLRNGVQKPAIIYRSTVPPGTMQGIVIPTFAKTMDTLDFPVIYHPEFLREGSAVADFFDHPQVVVAPVSGIDEDGLAKFIQEIYTGIEFRYYPVNTQTAEMIKYLNNSFHALKVVFANEVAKLCSYQGVDIHSLFRIFLDDHRLNISKAYLSPGFAFGGSCLPKDLRGIASMSRHMNVESLVLSSIERSNEEHIRFALTTVLELGARRIGFFGLSFKPATDDVRESAYVKLIELLIGKGKEIKIFDESIQIDSVLGKNLEYLIKHIPHVSHRLVKRREDLFEEVDLIVMCHFNEALVHDCRKNNIAMLDLTGRLKASDLSENIHSLFFRA
jgi:GDP-mannose 6-dehydrogenase